MKAVICDDEKAALEIIRHFIIQEQFPIEIAGTAENGMQALDLIRREKPQLVFMDIVMPVKDGVEAIREIRRFDPKAYIVVVSSVGTQTQLKNAILEGARDFVQKPYTFSAIAEILKGRFEGR